MIRYIDLKDQICDYYPEFAWFDTVTDRFVTFYGNQTWETWEDFEGDLKSTGGKDDVWNRGYDLDRFKQLFPSEEGDD